MLLGERQRGQSQCNKTSSGDSFKGVGKLVGLVADVLGDIEHLPRLPSAQPPNSQSGIEIRPLNDGHGDCGSLPFEAF